MKNARSTTKPEQRYQSEDWFRPGPSHWSRDRLKARPELPVRRQAQTQPEPPVRRQAQTQPELPVRRQALLSVVKGNGGKTSQLARVAREKGRVMPPLH